MENSSSIMTDKIPVTTSCIFSCFMKVLPSSGNQYTLQQGYHNEITSYAIRNQRLVKVLAVRKQEVKIFNLHPHLIFFLEYMHMMCT